MGQEYLVFPIEPTSPDLVDGTQAYNMGIRFSSLAARLCYGVRWRVPDTVETPPGGTHAVSLWSQDSETRLAYKEFTPVPGGYQDILFDTPYLMDPNPALYVAAVYTVHYVFSNRTVPEVFSPSGNLGGDLGRLAAFNGGAATAPFPGEQFGTPWYYVSPIADDGVVGGVTPTGQAIPVAVGNPTVDLGLAATPSGQAVPVAVGQPSVSVGLATSPAGLAIPVALGQPTVGQAGVQPDGLAIPVAIGQPTVAINRVAAPAGLAIPVGLGLPSVVEVDNPDSPNPPIVASTRARVITASTTYPRRVVSP
jgi:hypothetical protein